MPAVHLTIDYVYSELKLCTYQWHPPFPHPRVGSGISGDLTQYYVKNPSPWVLPDVNTPIYRQELIGDLT